MKYKGESYVQRCATVVIRLYVSYNATCLEKLGKMVHSMKQNGFYHDNQHVSTNLAAVSAQNTRETRTCTEHNSIATYYKQEVPIQMVPFLINWSHNIIAT